jgi:hypothetical protein
MGSRTTEKGSKRIEAHPIGNKSPLKMSKKHAVGFAGEGLKTPGNKKPADRSAKAMLTGKRELANRRAIVLFRIRFLERSIMSARRRF